MRNLKKFLALVLAMMMVFSLMVTVNAAADYTDRDQVSDTYQEAVDVTDALDIFRGRDGNTFQPQSNIRRDEFATVLYRLATGDVHDEHLDQWRGIVSFADIPAENWAAPYVAYAYSAGLMQGDGTNFHPTLNINGYDAALTLLRLLGYGKKGEYTGSYQLNVAIDGARIGLTNVVGTRNLNGAATREIIAELAYDALNCDMVYYDPAGGSYENDSRPDGNAKLGAVIFDMEIVRVGDTYKTNTLSTGTQLEEYFKIEADPFGRPESEYVVLVKGDVIYAGRPAPVAAYYGNFTKDNADAIARTATPDVRYNGSGNVSGDFWKAATNSNNGLWYIPDGNKPNSSVGMTGMEIEVYVLNDGTYRVVAREAYVAKVTSAIDKNGDIGITVYEGSGPASQAITLNKPTEASTDYYTAAYNTLANCKKDAIVAVYARPGWNAGDDSSYILEVAVMETESVTIRRINDNTYKIISTIETTDGKTYKLNNDAMMCNDGNPMSNKLVTGNGATRDLTVGNAVLYLLNGTVLFVDQTSAATSLNSGYAYLYDSKENNDSHWESEGGEEKYFYVKLLLADGTTTQVDASMAKVDGAYAYGSNPKTHIGELVFYTINDKTGAYTLTPIAGFEADTTNKLTITNSKSEGKVPTGTPNLNGNNNNSPDASTTYTVAFDSATVFIVVTTNSTGNYMVTHDVYSIYNVPNFENFVDGYVAAAAPLGTGGTNGGAVAANNDVARVVLLRDPGASNTLDGVHFIVKNTNGDTLVKERISANNVIEYYELQAVVDGVLSTVKVTEALYKNAGFTNYLLMKNPEVDAYGRLTTYSTLSDAATVYTFSNASAVSNDHIKLTGDTGIEDYLVTGTTAYVYTDEGTITAIALGNIEKDKYEGIAIRNNTKGVLSTLFLKEKS